MLFLACAVAAYGQNATTPKAAADTLTLNDGEQLIGHFVRATGGNVIFKSDALGELAIAWGKVKELHAAERYVVIGKDVKLTRRTDISGLPKGAVAVANQTVLVEAAPGAAPASIPVGNAAHIIDEASFQNALMHNPGLLEDWNGAVTGGASIVQATQQARSFTGSIALIRAVPAENWIDPRNRTLIDFSASDGFVIQPNTPKIKTEIYHADAERDEYFRGKDLYGFAQTSFDHNFSQGLDLETNLGAGLGDTVIKKANETLDFKGSIAYISQSFQAMESSHSLMGSNFIETFTRKSAHGILFLQQVLVTPTWSALNDYSASASASVSIPVFRRLGFTTAIADNYLNNPPPAFKKNSLQLTTGLTYTLR